MRRNVAHGAQAPRSRRARWPGLLVVGLLAGCTLITEFDERRQTEDTYARCRDSTDNDGDGYMDCDDLDCATFSFCGELSLTACQNGVDDDGDGKTDCIDEGCQNFDSLCSEKTVEACQNGLDDDKDGLIDCKDSGCAGLSICLESSSTTCGDGKDNDGDGLVDCADFDCFDERQICCTATETLFTGDDFSYTASCSNSSCNLSTATCCQGAAGDCCGGVYDCAAFDPSRWVIWGWPRPRLDKGAFWSNEPCTCDVVGLVSRQEVHLNWPAGHPSKKPETQNLLDISFNLALTPGTTGEEMVCGGLSLDDIYPNDRTQCSGSTQPLLLAGICFEARWQSASAKDGGSDLSLDAGPPDLPRDLGILDGHDLGLDMADLGKDAPGQDAPSDKGVDSPMDLGQDMPFDQGPDLLPPDAPMADLVADAPAAPDLPPLDGPDTASATPSGARAFRAAFDRPAARPGLSVHRLLPSPTPLASSDGGVLTRVLRVKAIIDGETMMVKQLGSGGPYASTISITPKGNIEFKSATLSYTSQTPIDPSLIRAKVVVLGQGLTARLDSLKIEDRAALTTRCQAPAAWLRHLTLGEPVVRATSSTQATTKKRVLSSISQPTVVKGPSGTGYLMIFAGSLEYKTTDMSSGTQVSHADQGLFLATSADGKDWSLHSTDTLFPATRIIRAAAGETLASPSLLLDSQGQYHLWYARGITSTSDRLWRIEHATSTDGKAWTLDQAGTSGLAPGASGSWDSGSVRDPSVLLNENGTLNLFYVGSAGTGSSLPSVGMATFDATAGWQRQGSGPVLAPQPGTSELACEEPMVLWDSTQKLYRMWYTYRVFGRTASIRYAVSLDGKTWIPYKGSGVYLAGDRGAFDERGVMSPTVLLSGHHLLLWYEGLDAQGRHQIGFAENGGEP